MNPLHATAPGFGWPSLVIAMTTALVGTACMFKPISPPGFLGDDRGGGSDGAAGDDSQPGGEAVTNGDNANGSGDNANGSGDNWTGYTPCPDTLPIGGETCSLHSLTCQYGTDPRQSCRPTATCNSNYDWVVDDPACAPSPAPPSCPARLIDAEGNPCPVEDSYCVYNEVPCRCTPCNYFGSVDNCSLPQIWRCVLPPADIQCPDAAPNAGRACNKEGLFCQYNCSTRRECIDGIWLDAGDFCPVSRRSAKRDIIYLDANDIDRIARELLGVRLATYRYRDPAIGGGDRLGFIIDDAPDLPSVAPDKQRVDLYGFASMLLAAVQSQAEQINDLRSHVDALEERLTTCVSPEPAPLSCQP